MNVYMAVTADELELPLIVADSASELGRILGRTRGDIFSMLSRKSVSLTTFNGYRYRIIKVDIDEEDDNG